MSRTAFIGLSGIPNRSLAADILEHLRPTQGRIVVMFAHKPGFFLPHERLLPAVHFRSDRRHGLTKEFQDALGWKNGSPAGTGFGITALAVDIPWPNPDELRSICQMSGQSVILHVGRQAFNEAWGSVDELAYRLNRYADAVTDVTFDIADMREVYKDPALARRILTAAKVSLPGVNLGVCEDLCRDTLIDRMLPLLRTFPGLCVQTDIRSLPANERRPSDIAQLVVDIAALAT